MTLQLSMPRMRVTTITGEPAQGWQLFFYESGSSTVAKTTFNDAAKNTANPNPVLSDASGWFPEVVLDGSYNIVLRDDADNLIWSVDPVTDVQTLIFNEVGGQVTQRAIQNQSYTFAVVGGTGDAVNMTALTPAITTYDNGLRVQARGYTGKNTISAPTITINSLAAKQIIKWNGRPLMPGDIAGGNHTLDMIYSTASDKFLLLNPARDDIIFVGECAVTEDTGSNIITAPEAQIPELIDGQMIAGFSDAAVTLPSLLRLGSAGSQKALETVQGLPMSAGIIQAGTYFIAAWNESADKWRLLTPDIGLVAPEDGTVTVLMIQERNISTQETAFPADDTPRWAYFNESKGGFERSLGFVVLVGGDMQIRWEARTSDGAQTAHFKVIKNGVDTGATISKTGTTYTDLNYSIAGAEVGDVFILQMRSSNSANLAQWRNVRVTAKEKVLCVA